MSPRNDGQRQLPHSLEAEIGVIGAVLNDNAAYVDIAGLLKPESFAIEYHRILWRLIGEAVDAGQVADVVMIGHKVRSDRLYEEAGGAKYLADMFAYAPPAALAMNYARLIHDLFVRRELIARLGEATDAAYDESSFDDASILLQSVEQKLAGMATITSAVEESNMKSMAEIGLEFIERIDAAARAQRGAVLGVPTGITDLDERLTGLKGGQVTIVAARPGMGKSVLALGVARHATTTPTYEEPNKPSRDRTALLWIGEMSRVDLFQRMAAAEKGIPVSAQTSSGLDGPRADELIEWAMQMENQGLYIDDTPFITIAALRRRAFQLKRQRGHLDLIVVDYLNQMTVEGMPAGQHEHQRLSVISRALTQIAKEFDCAVIAVTQLSRQVEMREDKRPMLSDLRESGSLEQDATNVLLLYRPEYYLQNDPEQGPRESTEAFANRSATHAKLRAAAAGKVEIICAKVRQGQTGTVLAAWDGPRMRITNVSAPPPPPQGSMYYDQDGF